MAELIPYEAIVRFELYEAGKNDLKSVVKEVKELIRCKDCKWFGEIGCAIVVVDDTDKPTENDYCSFAERKSNG